jgi:hypothetical protein
MSLNTKSQHNKNRHIVAFGVVLVFGMVAAYLFLAMPSTDRQAAQALREQIVIQEVTYQQALDTLIAAPTLDGDVVTYFLYTVRVPQTYQESHVSLVQEYAAKEGKDSAALRTLLVTYQEKL